MWMSAGSKCINSLRHQAAAGECMSLESELSLRHEAILPLESNLCLRQQGASHIFDFSFVF